LIRLNRLAHAATPVEHELLSSGWVDLTTEPMFLTLPDMGARPYSFAVVDMFGDTIDHVSRRLYGRRAPPHVLFGPSWTNPPPFGVRAIHATTNLVRLVGRIAVDGPDDLAAARAIQSRVLFETPELRNERRVLEARELMPPKTVIADEPFASWPAPRPNDPWDRFVVAARVLGEGPVPERDAALLEALTSLRLRPGRRFDLLGFSAAERAAMLDGLAAADREIEEAKTRTIRRTSGWHWPPAHPGDFEEDRLQRAIVASNDPLMPTSAESMTLVADADAAGTPLDGANHYVLRFVSGATPPGGSAWALSIAGQPVGGLRVPSAAPIEVSLPPRDGIGAVPVRLHAWTPASDVMNGSWRPPEIIRLH
jgi:hypothetical protein